MDDEDLIVGGEDLDYEEYDLDEDEEKALLEEEAIEEQIEEVVEEHEMGQEVSLHEDNYSDANTGRYTAEEFNEEPTHEETHENNGLNGEMFAVQENGAQEDYNTSDMQEHASSSSVHSRLQLPAATTSTAEEDYTAAEGEEEEEEDDGGDEGGRDRFKSERVDTSSRISLRNSSGNQRVIPDTLDEVVTAPVPERFQGGRGNRGPARGNRGRGQRGGAGGNGRGMNRGPPMQTHPPGAFLGSPIMNFISPFLLDLDWNRIGLHGTHLSSFFTFPIIFKWRETVAMLTPCLRHFSNTLTWILLNNRMQLLVLETTQTSSTLFIFKALIATPEFPEPPSYCSIPCGLFSPCSVDIGRSFGGVVPKFELVQHK
ncbi:hypothetical protein FHG87_002009 [Trinorchestia longiramus]|nr:hypothetical protein FHG87_002009 [Trinorchestia longiramus]